MAEIIARDVATFLGNRFGYFEKNLTDIEQKYPLIRNYNEFEKQSTTADTAPILIEPPTCGVDIFVLHGERASSIFSVGKLRYGTFLHFIKTFDANLVAYNARVFEAIKNTTPNTGDFETEEFKTQYDFALKLLEEMLEM